MVGKKYIVPEKGKKKIAGLKARHEKAYRAFEMAKNQMIRAQDMLRKTHPEFWGILCAIHPQINLAKFVYTYHDAKDGAPAYVSCDKEVVPDAAGGK